MVSELVTRNTLPGTTLSQPSLPQLSLSTTAVQRGQGLRDGRFLACSLADEMNIILPVQASVEVITITTEQITPIPHMSPWVMGIYNWRGEALWIIDLGHLFGLTAWHQQPNPVSLHSVLVLRGAEDASATGRSLGAVVGQVQDIQALDLNLLHAPSSALTTPQMAPFLRGYWLDSTGNMLAYLDVDAIFSMIAK